ncbi:alkylation response protein AidB-like acyl-CoA dehydrogenase [Sphingobium wenxiniae]|uniref:Alkylation response protein AidB-like acyl-CoA dehydrogenase n=1 Tax=Sphingobium wenxiniae (strain DSM 21828 / CGMCC 1.7748 / JZ-1) TaxID=595605 RepID=A0A562K879_SPHWJ|nr:acyl-CoA dehydrogenase family protein [Sphingobium wenxiniae]MBB6193482.1 alkylation response protein AidB-like acyl-CoA dehydrogenase [Sphingobium wenxiniae]TWH91444.1 alkylation response protein AidB-like acyl-CoA dehydrogenase [Sphingobium wenxiniae]
MDFSEPEHITMIRDTVRKFVAREANNEIIAKWDKADHFPMEIHRKIGDLGLGALTVPEEYGGAGFDLIAMTAVIEELSKASGILAGMYIHTACYGGMNITSSGSPEQKAQLLPRVVEGSIFFAYALSEPDVGADLAATKTTAQRKGDKIIINGAKRWCSGATIADYLLLLVKSDPDGPRYKNLSFLLVPPTLPGISITTVETMGQRGSPTCDVIFDNVEVGLDAILGGEAMWNQGWSQLAGPALEAEKLEVPAMALGVAEAALAEAWEYSQQRSQFGQRICSFQSIRHKLADAKTKVQACRNMLYWAAWLLQEGRPAAAETAMTKLFVCDTCRDVVLSCQQILGAYGYAEGFSIERHVRDVLVYPIYGGSSAIQLNNIANRLGLPKA